MWSESHVLAVTTRHSCPRQGWHFSGDLSSWRDMPPLASPGATRCPHHGSSVSVSGGRAPPPSSLWSAFLGLFPCGYFGVSSPGPEGRLPGRGETALSLQLNWGGWGGVQDRGDLADCRRHRGHTIGPAPGRLGEVAIQSPSRCRKPGRGSEVPSVTCRQLSWTDVRLGPLLALSRL